MAFRDFHDKAEKKYIENSDEAWNQIKAFFAEPGHWIVMGIAALLILAGVFTAKFLGAIRAPELPGNGGDAAPVQISGEERTITEDPLDEIDDSNTVHPVVSGARKEDYYTFLLIGTDEGGGNTDTLMVVSYDVKNQKLNLMSIPRDTMVNVSWDIKKINSVYSMSGLTGLKKHIGKLVGFVPDYYVRIDLNAFVEVVNLLGGVEFDVPISMHYHDPYQNLNIDLEPGLQTLNGEQAMGLVRFRKSDRSASGSVSGYDDTGRVQTQQAFLKAMFKQCIQIKNWTKITDYVEIFERDVESDLTLGEMLWFARQAMNLGEDGFNTYTIPGNYYASAWSRSTQQQQSYVTLYPRQVVELVNESFNPYLTNVTTANLDIMSINSDGSVSSSTGYVADSLAAQAPATGTRKPDSEDTEPDGEDGAREDEPDENAPAAGDENGSGGAEPGGETGESPSPGTEPEAGEPAESGRTDEGAEPPESVEPADTDEPADTPAAGRETTPENTDTTPSDDGGDEE